MRNPEHDGMNRLQKVAAVVMAGGFALASMGINVTRSDADVVNASQEMATSASTQGSVDMIHGKHWQLAGVVPKSNSLEVSATDEAIVQQSGAPGQNNPSVNLYGTILKERGGFNVTTGISSIKGSAQVSLYGKPPLIEDEFRAEEGTLDMKISGNTFTATISDQLHGKNVRKVSKSISTASKHVVSMTDSGGKVSLAVDNHNVGSMPDDGIFKTGEVYVGFDARSAGGKFTVNKMTAKGVSGGKVSTFDTRTESIKRNPNGFAALANKKRPGFLMGAAVALGPMVSDPIYRNIVGNENELVIENALKMQNSQPQRGKFNFAESDALIAMARKDGMKVHGHAIVFGEANPAWVQYIARNNPSALPGVLVNHVKTLATHDKGKVDSWDLNELLADYDTTPGQYGMRQNIWYKAMGPQYVVIAAKALRAADPNAMICLNDFGMESDDGRFGQMVNLIQFMKANGAPVDCVGFQSHIDDGDTNANDNHIDANKLKGRFTTLEALGVKARVSELDVSSTAEYSVYQDVVKACIESPNCVGVTTWGVTDEYSSAGSINAKGIFTPGMGLPWNSKEQAIPAAVNSIKAALQ